MSRTNLLAALAALVVMTIAVFAFSDGDDNATRDRFPEQPAIVTEAEAPAQPSPAEAAPNPEASDSPNPRFSDLPTISIAELPIEALDTLVLIGDGGPYPYRQDDGVFQNREGILPDQPRGHYREYTVDTPGSPDRGARRIVAGDDGERYYTDDHYDSFREIVFDPELESDR